MFKPVDQWSNLKLHNMKSVIVGIDVSKETLDLMVLINGQKYLLDQLNNKTSELKKWLKALLKQSNQGKASWLICMEHTGIYCNHVIEASSALNIDLWIEDASRIKAFHSLSRGKKDSLDAERIAKYAYLKREEAKIWEPPRDEIQKLKALSQLRKRLLNTEHRLTVPMGEEEFMHIGSWAKEHKNHIKSILKNVRKEIKIIETQMHNLIFNDEYLRNLYDLVTSVKGVGPVTAVAMLVMTNEFKWINDPRKMACHCGVAPFPYESGKSIRGKSKVSHRAHKPMKVLLNLGARSAVSSPGELRDYYDRKVNEGKNKMVVLNAIRNKLIHRIFACVRDNRKYDKIYTPALA